MTKHIQLLLALASITILATLGSGCSAKHKEAYYLQQADDYYNAGKFDQAEIEYENVLRIDSQNAQAWGRLGVIYFNQGRFGAAAPYLMNAQKLATNNVEVRAKLAVIYLARQQWDEARNEATTVLAQSPKDGQAPILLAESAVTPADINDMRLRLQQLAPNGNPAAFAVALGILAFREHDVQTAEGDFKRALALDPKFSDAYSALGDLYFSNKDFKQADQAYKTAADLVPANLEKEMQYAQFKIASGDIVTGKSLMESMTKTDPSFVPPWISLAQMAFGEKKYQDAAALLSGLLSRDPDNFDGRILDSEINLAETNTAAAVTELEALTKKYPQAPPALYQLAVAYLANNDTGKATDCLTQALNLDPKFTQATLLLSEIQLKTGAAVSAITALRQLVQQQPQLIQAWLLLADAYGFQNNWDAALQIYRQLEKTYPKNAQVHLLAGTVLFQQKQNDSARAEFEQALDIAPDYLPALEQLVAVDLADKQFDAASQRVQQAVQKNPQSAVLQLLLAKVATARGDSAQAEAILSKAISLQPDSPVAYLMLAQLYADTHQDQKALDELQTTLAQDPTNAPALALMGMVYDNEGKYQAAATAYQKLLAAEPDSLAGLNNLACLDAGPLNQLDEAYQLARKARDLQPTDPAIADTLGWVLCKQKQYSSALVLLQESVSQLGDNPEVQFHLGMTYYLMGDAADAQMAFQRALQLNKNFADSNECTQCLAVLAVDVKTADANVQANLEKRAAGHPDDIIALLRLAAIYQRNGATNKATDTYEAVLSADPQNVSAMVNLARLYAPTDVQKAFGFAKAANKLAPDDPNVSLTLGRLAFQTGDYKWAYNLLQQSIQSFGNDPSAEFDFGMAAYSIGKVSTAETAVRNALQVNPAFAQAAEAKQFLDLLALLQNPTGVTAQASRVEVILKSEPDYVPALMVEAVIDEQKSDVAAAEKEYQSVLNLYPDFAPAQAQLAALFVMDPSDDQQTYALATKAFQTLPNDPGLMKILGIVVYRTAASSDDYARAATLLAQSAAQHPNDAVLQYYLGMAQYQLKHPAEAKAALQQALTLDPSGPFAGDARKTLTELK